MNLVSCHGFVLKPNSTVILNFRSRLVNNYLSNRFLIIEHNSKQLISRPNDVKLIIYAIDQIEIDFVDTKNTAISSVANTMNKFHIQSDLHFIYKKNLYNE